MVGNEALYYPVNGSTEMPAWGGGTTTPTGSVGKLKPVKDNGLFTGARYEFSLLLLR
jgi:hypothetical protein